MEYTIKLVINDTEQIFDNINDAQEYLNGLHNNSVTTDFIKKINEEEEIQNYLKANDYMLPLGTFWSSSYKGMTETYEDEYVEEAEYSQYYKSVYPLITAESAALFHSVYDDTPHSYPTIDKYSAKISEDFSSLAIIVKSEDND